MDIQNFCDRMNFEAAFSEQLTPYGELLWENSSETFPFFMEKDFYTRYYPWCEGPDPAGIYRLMEEVGDLVRSNPAAARYASMLHYAFFKARPELSIKWVSPETVFGQATGIFQLLIALSALPLIAEKYAEWKLPEKYLRGIAQWIGGTIGIYAAAHDGYPGHSLEQTSWLRFSVDGRLFRIGRLEFLSLPWSADFPAIYRKPSDGSLMVLCLDGWAFDEEGFLVDPDRVRPVFTARLNFLDGQVTGTPISPFGKPVRDREVTLNLSEWEPLCAPWENVTTIHIPAGGGMTSPAIRSSLLEARQFYHDYLGQDIKVFSCSSWVLNPAWEQELPNSNMADLQRNVYLIPCRQPAGMPGVFFVYGDDNCDPRTRPQTTNLHQAFCRILDRGEPLRAGFMFLPADEAELYGTEYYRTRYKF